MRKLFRKKQFLPWPASRPAEPMRFFLSYNALYEFQVNSSMMRDGGTGRNGAAVSNHLEERSFDMAASNPTRKATYRIELDEKGEQLTALATAAPVPLIATRSAPTSSSTVLTVSTRVRAPGCKNVSTIWRRSRIGAVT
jgi:hypothetical protein